LTLSISVIAQFLGLVLGTLSALARTSKRFPLRLIARVYVWIFRGTPLLVQLTFFFFGLSVTGIYRWPSFDILGIPIPGEVQAELDHPGNPE